MTTPKVEAVDFMWWHDMPWSASCKDVKGAVAMRGLPTPDFDALTARLKRVEEALDNLRAYAVKCVGLCQEAAEERRSDIRNSDNNAIGTMLREQEFAWSEKAKSYEALVRVIDDETTKARAALDGKGG